MANWFMEGGRFSNLGKGIPLLPEYHSDSSNILLEVLGGGVERDDLEIADSDTGSL